MYCDSQNQSFTLCFCNLILTHKGHFKCKARETIFSMPPSSGPGEHIIHDATQIDEYIRW